MSIELVILSNHLILCHPLLLLLSIFPIIRVFFFFFSPPNELTFSIRWPKYWSFSLSISSSNEYSELTSFRIDWFDLAGLILQGTLKSLLQHHNLETSVFQHSALFKGQLSHLHITTGKTIALPRQTLGLS